MKKVFSKEKFIEYEGMNEYLKCKAWVDECDGLTAKEMLKKRYIFSPTWMIEVDELASKKYLEQIAKSEGVDPFTKEIKSNALLFPVAFREILKDLEILETLKKHLFVADLTIACFISGNPDNKDINECTNKPFYEEKFNELKEWIEKPKEKNSQ